MGSGLKTHDAEGGMDYCLRGHEDERNNCFSKIHPVGLKNIEAKHLSLVKASLKSFLAAKKTCDLLSMLRSDWLSYYKLLEFFSRLKTTAAYNFGEWGLSASFLKLIWNQFIGPERV